MRRSNPFDPQLALNQILLLPGGEWMPRTGGWSFIRVHQGLGYWLHPRTSRELACGSILVLSDFMDGTIRASKICELDLRYFHVEPEKLSGILTLAEQRILHELKQKEEYAIHFLSSADPLAEDFQRLCENQIDCSAGLRLQLLDFFISIFKCHLSGNHSELVDSNAAKARLENLLRKMHPVDILELTVAGLANRVGCSPRHLGRLFQQAMGVSFREKKAQLRLGKAQELLLNRKSKVIDVAFESGYQSLSLFNQVFKRRFGVTPAQWRELPTRNGVLHRL